jgi:tryptophan-rich sensory protein
LKPGRAALGLLGWLAVTFGAAALGAIASSNAGAFYGELSRPAWAPPGSVFAPVWTTLYALMALAAWLVWRQRGWRGAGAALALYLVQLAANALWTWLFFVARQGALAFVEALLLAALVAATAAAFWRVRPLAGALFLPYLAWVTFAAALTYSVWQRNPTLL